MRCLSRGGKANVLQNEKCVSLFAGGGNRSFKYTWYVAGRLHMEKGPGVWSACFGEPFGINKIHNRPSSEKSFSDPIIDVHSKTWICICLWAIFTHSLIQLEHLSCWCGTDPQQMGVIFQGLGICLAFMASMWKNIFQMQHICYWRLEGCCKVNVHQWGTLSVDNKGCARRTAHG